VVICLERGADLHMAQLMPLPLTVTCFSKIQTDFAFLVPANLGSSGKWAVNRVCVGQFYKRPEGRAEGPRDDLSQLKSYELLSPEKFAQISPTLGTFLIHNTEFRSVHSRCFK